jgi:hypothetical protein
MVGLAMGQVTMSWEDKLYHEQASPLKISTTNVQLRSLTFYANQIFATSFDANKVGFVRQRSGSYHASPCVDSTTRQILFYLSFLDLNQQRFDNFQVEDPDFDQAVNGVYPNHEFVCYIQLRQEQLEDVNIRVTSPIPSLDIQVKLALPTYYEPQIDFKSAKITKKPAQDVGSIELEIEFTTDTIGSHYVTINNGPAIDLFNSNTDKLVDLYCSSGNDKQFAHIGFVSGDGAYVRVTKLPSQKQSIKCKFSLEYYGSDWTYVVNDAIYVSIALSRSVVHKPLDYVSPPATLYASQYNLSGQSTRISTGVYGANIKINSTVEITFSNHLDVSSINIPTNEQGYRGFSGCNWYYRPSIAVKGNTIVLSDFPQASTSLDCTFNFNGPKFFKFGHAKQASVSLKVDGVAADAANSPSREVQIYFRTYSNIEFLKQTETIDNSEITLVDRFVVNDSFDDSFVSPSKPVLVFGISGPTTFNEENYKDQLKCQLSTPSSTALSDLTLKFDSNTHTWSAPIDSIVNTDKYSLILSCTRKIKQYSKFGLDVTPISVLNVQYVDLIDNKRYADQGSSAFSDLQQRTQAKSQTGSYPGLISYYANARETVLLPYNENIKQQIDTIMSNAPTSYPTALKGDSKYGFTPVDAIGATYSASQSNRYSSYDVLPQVITYLKDVTGFLGQKSYDWASSLPIFGSFNRDLDIYSPNSPTVTVAKMFKVTIPDGENNPAQADLANNFSLALYKASQNTKLGEGAIHTASGSSVQLGQYTNIEQCGISSLYFDRSFEKKLDDEEDEADQWDSFVSASRYINTCAVGQACTVNADCTSNICQGSTCRAQRQIIYPYIKAGNVETAYQESEFYNSASGNTIVSALIIAVVTLLFAM